MIWSEIIDVVRTLVFIASQACGHSVGGGILLVSFAARVALLPLTLRMARRAREHQTRIAAIAPKLAKLRQRHASDQAALEQATLDLYRQHGIGLLPKGSLLSILVQAPVGAALYRAFGSSWGTRTPFLWISDLARPDTALALVCATLAGVAAGAEPSISRAAIVMNMIVTGYLAWRLSASVGLYWAASSGVSAVQALVLRRSASQARPA
jgi:YidC/Oxa1 family membrane protein insertase